MTVAALCAAAVEYSDNAAANLLLRELGGPAGLTEFARSIGDPVTRLDRYEPEVNTAIPGDERDTTTPGAMLRDLDALLLGPALSSSSRAQLETWLVNSVTGTKCLRAGLPSEWRVGDKTGAGDNGTRNDIAIARPQDRPPILIVAYITGSGGSAPDRDAALVEIGRLAAGLRQRRRPSGLRAAKAVPTAGLISASFVARGAGLTLGPLQTGSAWLRGSAG